MEDGPPSNIACFVIWAGKYMILLSIIHTSFPEQNGRPGSSGVPLLKALRRRSEEHSSAPRHLTQIKLLGSDDGRPHKWLSGENNSCLTYHHVIY